MVFVEYSKIRDKYWSKYYPVTRILYRIFNFFAKFGLIINGIYVVGILIYNFNRYSIERAIEREWIAIFLVPLGFIILVGIFFYFKELILFQIDKNFYLYTSCSEDLKKIVEDEKSE